MIQNLRTYNHDRILNRVSDSVCSVLALQGCGSLSLCLGDFDAELLSHSQVDHWVLYQGTKDRAPATVLLLTLIRSGQKRLELTTLLVVQR